MRGFPDLRGVALSINQPTVKLQLYGINSKIKSDLYIT
ncbi:hypothetical protein NIES2100_57480 [Calothrix sp. NIES-2100]|nr:hypothetical protein NIES2100_57480 [Calothrix sp. NIES-2100]